MLPMTLKDVVCESTEGKSEDFVPGGGQKEGELRKEALVYL